MSSFNCMVEQVPTGGRIVAVAAPAAEILPRTAAPRDRLAAGRAALTANGGGQPGRVPGVPDAAQLVDQLGCARVELETHAIGEGSRAPLLQIGAVDEGTLRPHMVAQRGRLRDSVCFTIVETEWPAVRALLETGLAADPTA